MEWLSSFTTVQTKNLTQLSYICTYSWHVFLQVQVKYSIPGGFWYPILVSVSCIPIKNTKIPAMSNWRCFCYIGTFSTNLTSAVGTFKYPCCASRKSRKSHFWTFLKQQQQQQQQWAGCSGIGKLMLWQPSALWFGEVDGSNGQSAELAAEGPPTLTVMDGVTAAAAAPPHAIFHPMLCSANYFTRFCLTLLWPRWAAVRGQVSLSHTGSGLIQLFCFSQHLSPVNINVCHVLWSMFIIPNVQNT